MSINSYDKKSYLFILPWSLESLGGVNQVVENLFHQMNFNGKYKPMVMVNSWNDIKIRKQNIKGIDHYFFRLRSPWDSVEKIRNILAFLFEFIKTSYHLNKFFKLNSISVANTHYCSLSSLNISYLKFTGRFRGSFILSFHGKDLFFVKKSRGIEKLLWKILLNSADKIITCSEALKEELANFHHPSSDKIIPIHNGIDISSFINDEEFNCLPDLKNKKFILNVATLEWIKGQDVLVNAFAKIAPQFRDLNLVLIGRPGGVENKITQLIDSLGLSHKVHLYNGLPHDKVLSIIKRAMIFVLPSRYEAFGIVILEAGAFGVPVIASNVGGIREILSHNDTGRLCEPEDVDSLADELRRLLAEPEERNRLGENLRKRVLENYSWGKTCIKYLETITHDDQE